MAAKAKPRESAVLIHDRALEAVHRVERLTALLQGLGRGPDSFPVEPDVIAGTAGDIREELAKVRRALAAMHKLVPSQTKFKRPPRQNQRRIAKTSA